MPLESIDTSKLGLIKPGVLTVGTLSDAPPSICVNSDGVFTGYDNEVLKAIGEKLGLEVQFVGTEFAGLLAQVAGHRFDVGSSSITTTDERRNLVGFTNGYDFGYFSLVVPNGSPITGFADLNASTRIGVVQGTVQDDYVVNTLNLDPVKFPDYNTAYANLKTGQIDAWVAPSQQAEGAIAPGDATSIVENTFSVNNFVGWAVAKENQPLIDALNSGLDAVIADGTWAELYTEWVPRELPEGWKPGSRAAPEPELPDFAALAAESGSEPAGTPVAEPKSALAQLGDTFFDWELYKKAFPRPVEDGSAEHLDPRPDVRNRRHDPRHAAGGGRDLPHPLAALARPRLHRHLPGGPARRRDHPARRSRGGGGRSCRASPATTPPTGSARRHCPCWPRHTSARSSAPASSPSNPDRWRRRVRSASATGSRCRWWWSRSIRRVLPALMNQFIALIKDSSLIYFLGLLATQRELFAVGRDLNAQTGNLSPLVAAGLFYLILTVPLTHLVNYIDHRLRVGRKETTLDPLEQDIVVERG